MIPTVVLLVAAGIATFGVLAQAASGDGRSPGVRSLAVIARESMGRMLVLTMGIPGRFEAGPVANPRSDDSRVPVLMVPGYGTNRMVFWFLRQYLHHRGWQWVWPVNHAGQQVDLAGQARVLGERIAVLKRVSGAEQVDLVGFSMGGLVCAWYASHGGTDVRRLVTLGSPWAGSELARRLSTPVGAQMTRNADSLRKLDATAVPTTAIWSPDDPVVVPASSAAPAGAVSVQVDGAGHLDLMLNARVYRAVHQALVAP